MRWIRPWSEYIILIVINTINSIERLQLYKLGIMITNRVDMMLVSSSLEKVWRNATIRMIDLMNLLIRVCNWDFMLILLATSTHKGVKVS
jgi:hypothetical protein